MNIKQIVTTAQYHWQETPPINDQHADVEIIFDRQKRYQKHLGFGGAVTDSATISFNYLSDDKKEEYLNAYFSPQGLNYHLLRYPLGSCDFSTHNYHYLSDEDINHLSVDCDKDRIAFIHKIKEKQNDLSIFASPWSPPAFMKDNQQMNNGGKLLPKYYDLYAKSLLKAIQMLREKGVYINVINLQNEPLATQTWDSCIYSGKEEAYFLSSYLIKEIKNNHVNDLSIGIWDHNRDVLKERIDETFATDLKVEDVNYLCYHWYSKSDFEQLDYIHDKYPSLSLIMSEGCAELLIDKKGLASLGDFSHAEMYIHQIINDLNHYCQGYIDWNLSLDDKGGPNHAGNYCEAPIMISPRGEMKYNHSYYAIGHFSKFIDIGATRIYTSSSNNKIEVVAYENLDQSLVLVIYNSDENDHYFSLCDEVRILKGKSVSTLQIK